jgi:outer membrane receptor protein involved in Fe transport
VNCDPFVIDLDKYQLINEQKAYFPLLNCTAWILQAESATYINSVCCFTSESAIYSIAPLGNWGLKFLLKGGDAMTFSHSKQNNSPSYRIKKLPIVTAIGIALAMPASLNAASDGRQIEEVIVTAERQEASIQDTSISITAFTGAMLEDFGIRNQEDLQNFVPATTIQPYDATIRGVGRNFRALGGDPGVATYMNGVYSEDLLTATAATFWDVERIEVLRGPQGTLYGRNAVGGAINILYKKPSQEFDYAIKAIAGNYGTQELYGMVNGKIVEDLLSGRFNLSSRDRDGVI